MKRDYIALWALLAVSFVFFFCFSTCGDLTVGPVTVKSSSLADFLKVNPPDTPAATDSVVPDSDAVTDQSAPVQIVVGNVSAAADVRDSLALVASIDSGAVAPVAPATAPTDTTGGTRPLRVLIIGDSMLEGLAPRLAAYCQASGYQLYSVIWYSSTSEIYAKARLISRYISDIHPEYIFLSLGGNELFVRDIIEKRDGYVKSIIAEIGDIPYLWIGPPNWKPDTGINQLIRDNVPQGCYFCSDGMHFDRKKDGAHPTQDSAIEWMDSIMRWMPANAKYLLSVQTPQSRTARPKKQYMHKPGPTP